VLLLPGGTDVRPPPEAAPNKRYDLVYAGKLERRKGLFDLLEALGHLPGVTLAVAGGGPDAVAAARAIAERLGVADRVDFLGWVAPADVPALLQSARIGCCPLPQGVDHVSDSFTVPLKMLQMMGLGLPIVATDIGPVRNLVEHEVHALLPPPSAPSALADAARRLIGDEALSRRLGSAARARAESYAWPNRAARFATFAEELPMSGERPASAIKPG
jgi:glycosyltransferase involved in cell wall biosynthesis